MFKGKRFWEGPERSRAVVILTLLLLLSTFMAVRNWRCYRNERRLNEQITGSEYWLVPVDEPAVPQDAEVGHGE